MTPRRLAIAALVTALTALGALGVVRSLRAPVADGSIANPTGGASAPAYNVTPAAPSEGSSSASHDPAPPPLVPIAPWRPEPAALARLASECEAGVGGACGELVRTFFTSGHADDHRAGVDRALTLCSSGDVEVCGMLGQFAHDHAVALPTPHSAETLLATACAAGLQPYCTALDKLRGVHVGDPDPALLIAEQIEADRVAQAQAAADRDARCDAGDAVACTEAANVALTRDPTDPAAREVLRTRCQHDPAQCAALADHLARTESTVDRADAVAVAESGCERGAQGACDLLPKLRGEAIEDPYIAEFAARERVRAEADRTQLAEARSACDAGAPDRCIEAARMIFSGLGAEAVESDAVALLRRACDLGAQEGCVELGIALLQNQSADVGASIEEVSALFTAACDAGYAGGCEQATKLALR